MLTCVILAASCYSFILLLNKFRFLHIDTQRVQAVSVDLLDLKKWMLNKIGARSLRLIF